MTHLQQMMLEGTMLGPPAHHQGPNHHWQQLHCFALAEGIVCIIMQVLDCMHVQAIVGERMLHTPQGLLAVLCILPSLEVIVI